MKLIAILLLMAGQVALGGAVGYQFIHHVQTQQSRYEQAIQQLESGK
jgi:uncharacterized membrane protein